MFLNQQNSKNIDYYKNMLGNIGALSRLFSDSKEPYIPYRIAENLFCKSFDAENLSRTDCSADAAKSNIGIGIKTFLEKNGSTLQKVAEFNSDHRFFEGLDIEEKICKVAELRNERIDTTMRIFNLETMLYHCITRKTKGIIVYEAPMNNISINKISNIERRKNVLYFDDSSHQYSFNISKSTLYQRFYTKNIIFDHPVEILDDPFNSLEKMLTSAWNVLEFSPIREQEHVILPLYSFVKGDKVVPPKSGLNQWNAAGRPRDPNEIYIPIPSWINEHFSGFFPDRDKAFTLILPDKREMSAKICQDNSKALMSNPNSELGKWLLRDVLNLRERELLTYDKLDRIGLDSVVIYKVGDNRYDIEFTAVGSSEEFKEGFD